MWTLAQDATLQDVVNSVDNLYAAVSDNTIASLQSLDLVWYINDKLKGVYSVLVVIAFVVCFALGWYIWGRIRPRGGLLR